jgi:two-component system OmpR family response regulator
MDANRSPRILLAADDESVVKLLCDHFESDGYTMEVTPGGARLLELVQQREYQLLILDPSLSGLSGLDFLLQLRAQGSKLPVLILVGSGRVEDRVAGLDAGADDCVVKPFSLYELAARVRALLRRGGAEPSSVLRVADLELDRLERKVHRAGLPIALTPKEFAVLECLMCHAGQPVDRATIFERIWGFSTPTMTNLVDVYINYLRRKVDNSAPLKLIQTVRGVGYRMISPAECSAPGSAACGAASLQSH